MASNSISVIMSVCNGISYLRDAVESILNQTFRDFEFIIIDDGSTDGSTELLLNYANRDPRIRLIIQEKKGLTKSLNIGLLLAQGEFIARMDADDISLPNRLDIQFRVMQASQTLAALGGSPIYINEKNQRLFQRNMPLSHEEICRAHLTGWGGFIVHPSAIMRASAIQEVHGYDEKYTYAQDYDLWCRLSRKWKLKNIAEPLIFYRYHNKSISNKTRNLQGNAVKNILHRELAIAHKESLLNLNQCHEIYPDDDFWLLGAASNSGCFNTTYCISNKLFKKSFKTSYFAFKHFCLVILIILFKKRKAPHV